jgi:hypothetical protein
MKDRLGDDLILDRMTIREQKRARQADALDLKASYVLVALIFLAQLAATGSGLKGLTICTKADLWLASAMIALSGVFVFLELTVKSFKAESAEELEAR